MAYDEALALRIRKAIARRKRFAEKEKCSAGSVSLNGEFMRRRVERFAGGRLARKIMTRHWPSPLPKEFDITGR